MRNIITMLTAALCLLFLGGTDAVVAQQQTDAVHLRFLSRLVQGAENGEMQGKPIATFMNEEKVAFLQGGFSQLKEAMEDTSSLMEITMMDGKRYAVSFWRNQERVITISYPVSYQLIFGVTLIDAENALMEEVFNTSVPNTEEAQIPIDLLQRDGNTPVYILSGDSYVLPELNANRYYVSENDTNFSLLYSEDFPAQTMANLVTGTEISNQFELNITLVKYGYQTENAKVLLHQWVAYCIEAGCLPYFGVISNEDGRMVCELVMSNEAFGYAHVMKLWLNTSELASRKGIVNARLNSYVPMSNVKAIFSENN